MSHCHDEHAAHGGHDHGHDHDHDHSDDITPALQSSLYQQIVFDDVVTLNESERDAGKVIVRKTWGERLSDEPELMSDADEQLLMTVPYVLYLDRVLDSMSLVTFLHFAFVTVSREPGHFACRQLCDLDNNSHFHPQPFHKTLGNAYFRLIYKISNQSTDSQLRSNSIPSSSARRTRPPLPRPSTCSSTTTAWTFPPPRTSSRCRRLSCRRHRMCRRSRSKERCLETCSAWCSSLWTTLEMETSLPRG